MLSKALHLIYLEDEGLVAQNTLELLSESGYSDVDHFRGWEKAEAALDERSYDAAILDVNLGDSKLDGIDIGGVLNAKYRMPIVITTSFSDERTLTRLAALPYAQYVHKPFTAGQLDACLRRVLKSAPGREINVPPSRFAHLARRLADTKFVRSTGRHHYRIDFEKILYLAADGAYTDIHFCDGAKRTVDMGIRATIKFINRDDLFQIHKSYAVPHHAISRFNREQVFLRDSKALPLGRAYREGLRGVLG